MDSEKGNSNFEWWLFGNIWINSYILNWFDIFDLIYFYLFRFRFYTRINELFQFIRVSRFKETNLLCEYKSREVRTNTLFVSLFLQIIQKLIELWENLISLYYICFHIHKQCNLSLYIMRIDYHSFFEAKAINSRN